MRRRTTPTTQDRRRQAQAARIALGRLADRFQTTVAYAKDPADLLDNRERVGPLTALAAVAAELEALRAGQVTGNPAVEDEDLAAALALLPAADQAREYAELVVLAALRARGHEWPAIARARGYSRSDEAAQRYERLREQFPAFEEPGPGTLSDSSRRARHLLALTDTSGVPDYLASEARRVLTALLYAAALAGADEAAVREWIRTGDYRQALAAAQDAPADPRGVAGAISDHAEAAPAIRAPMDDLLTRALTAEDEE